MSGYVYIIRANVLHKIGSAQDLERRLSQLRAASPYLEKVQTIRCYAYRQIEKELHFIFAHKRMAGEWFVLDERDLDLIASIDWSSFPAEVAALNPDHLFGEDRDMNVHPQEERFCHALDRMVGIFVDRAYKAGIY